LRADQVSQVRGFADQHLRNKKNPQDPSNRRISIIVQYMESDVQEAPAQAAREPAGTKPSAALPKEKSASEADNKK
jgi:chemotaxis protein MotB